MFNWLGSIVVVFCVCFIFTIRWFVRHSNDRWQDPPVPVSAQIDSDFWIAMISSGIGLLFIALAFLH